jgi:FlaG/FlaF family flagellin (archaellin)
MKRMNEEAVSPVVGVMLMLVVTIIIAAVVSGFAGGLAGDQSKAPQATLGVTEVIQGIEDDDITNYDPDNPPGFEAHNGLLFEHMGGDPFGLNDIDVQVQTQDAKITIGLDDTIPSGTTCLNTTKVTAYLMEIGDTDGFITPGDKFMLYADNCYDSSEGAWGPPQGRAITGDPDNAAGGFAAFLNTKCEYKVIDKASGKVIQTGTFVLS